MNTVGLSAIRIQAASSLTGKAPAFAAITKEEALRAKTVYYLAFLGDLNLEIKANPKTGKMSLTETPVGTCIALTDEWDLPLSNMSLSPMPGVSYEVHYSK